MSYLLFGISIMQLCTKPPLSFSPDHQLTARQTTTTFISRATTGSSSPPVRLRVQRTYRPVTDSMCPFAVYIIFALDIFQSVATAAMGWHALCTGWGRPSSLSEPGWTFSAIPAVSGIGQSAPIHASFFQPEAG